MPNFAIRFLTGGLVCGTLTHCGSSSLGPGNMGGPSVEEREARIANEATGDFYYGRRYFVEKTRFWGYLRKPGQPWSRAKLVIFKEHQQTNPDRLPEDGPAGQRYAFDNNYEYRIRGYFTGRDAYEPNSNQFLQEFMLTNYDVVDRNPGWLFRPNDRYDRFRITLYPR
ncbi:MAG: hypothetical protein NTW21_16390 [Verrucomicrobia bacterium]|nr:hypothetical protein [Verrucomicrobiota bacterium]